jgi:hypothetical protein
MPKIRLDLSDAVELAELLTLHAGWHTSSQQHALADSLTAHLGHDAYSVDELHTDLHRHVFLLGFNDGEQLFEGPTP